jgi:hypothetical protein
MRQGFEIGVSHFPTIRWDFLAGQLRNFDRNQLAVTRQSGHL